MIAVEVGRFENGQYVTIESTPAQKRGFAQLLQSRQAPGMLGLDRSFNEGKHNACGMDDMPDWQKQMTLDKARKAGINITGKWYNGSLADFRGPADPRAWVSSLGEAAAVVKERRLFSRGAIINEPELLEPEPDVPLAPDLVREAAAEILAKDPQRGVGEVCAEVIQKRGLKKSKGNKHYGKGGKFIP